MRSAWAGLVVCVLSAACSHPATTTPVPPAYRFDPARAAELARTACTSVASVRQQIARNAPAREVFAGLATATDQAVRAEHADPKWSPLPGAVAGLAAALKKDDAQAALLALGLLDAECSQARS